MNIEELRDYCLGLEGTEEKTPFGRFAPRFASLLVFYVSGHMYCMADIDHFEWVAMRLTEAELAELRERHAAVETPLNPGLRHWAQISLGGDIPDRNILALVSRAHAMVKARYAKKPKKRRAASD